MKFEVVKVAGGNKIRLNIDSLFAFFKRDAEMTKRLKQMDQYLTFSASTYNIIRNYDPTDADSKEAFDHIANGPNFVFNNDMTPEEQLAIATFFAHANYCIKDTLGKFNDIPVGQRGSVVDFSRQLGEQYLELIKSSGLIDKFRDYTKSSVRMQDTSAFGTRPQDTRELTFDEEEMRDTMIIACLCKLAAPIFGEIISNLPEQAREDGKKKLPKDKEGKCVAFITAAIADQFPLILDKLQNYIHHIVMSLTSKNQDSAAIFCGFTPNTRTSIIMSSLFVRNFVSCDLEKNESNIIRYTDTMVRTLVQTQDSSAHKSQVRTRKAPGSMMATDDSNNADQMEVDSLVSLGTMDGPILVKCAIDDIVTGHRRDLDITRADFQKCLDYFAEHPICQTPLNMFAVTAVFGREIGGGRGIEMVDSLSYTKLVAMLQLMAFGMGHIQFGNFLTATKSVEVKLQLTLEEENFKRQATTLSHYRACREQFSKASIAIGDQIWDKQMANMLDDLAYNIYHINTPDYILEMVPEGSTEPIGTMFNNGDVLVPTVDVTEQLCAMVQVYSSDLQN